MMTVRPLTLVLVVALTTTLLSACGGSSSGGVYNQAFNVSGQWTGTLSDSTGVARAASMTLSDGGGDVTGTLSVVGHTCISGGNLTGTAVQAPANTTGDNPLTGDQENSNEGSVSLTVTSGQASGGVSAVTIDGGGSGYTSAPVVNFSLPSSGGTRASGTAIIGGAGRVVSITADAAGTGYTQDTEVIIAPPYLTSGVQATATATISSGAIVGYVITNPGSGYTIVPGVTIIDQETQGVSSISVTLGGSGYTSATTVTVSPPEISTGIQAMAKPIIANGVITRFTIVTAGSGYTTVPDVTITDVGGGSGADGLAVLSTFSGGSGAVATAVLNESDAGQVTGVVITDPGSGYITAPTVSLSGGGGSGAIATATIDAATVTDSVTFTLTGSSSSLAGNYSGVWKSTTTSCASQIQGTITLSRL
jgi:hypothetical protein